MADRNKRIERLLKIYKEILDKYHKGYIKNIADIGYDTDANGRIHAVVQRRKQHLFYSKNIVRKLTGKNPKALQKWIDFWKNK